MYCAAADVYIDPWRPVERALITHAHSDHARAGSNLYVAHQDSIPLLTKRLGPHRYEPVQYGETRTINGVNFTFYPAGHVLGSSQILVEYKGERWVASGDYKLQNDGISTPFEPVRCHTFITESTFGLPIFHWKPQHEVMAEINAWWMMCKEQGKTAILFAYSLGKAQRILSNIDHSIGTVWVHGAVDEMNKAYAEAGILLPEYQRVTADTMKSAFKGGLVIAPGSADGSPWMKKFEPYETANASGWMSLRGARRRGATDRGFILSDHADWEELNTAVKATNASQVIVTHGYTQTFAKWLNENGIDARETTTRFSGEAIEESEEQT